MDVPASETIVLGGALWEWGQGATEKMEALFRSPGLLPAYDQMLLHLGRIWDGKPPSASAAADRMEQNGGKRFAQALRDAAPRAREWDPVAYAAALEELEVSRFLRDAVQHERTWGGARERFERALAEKDLPIGGLGLRRVWSMSELPDVPPPDYAWAGLLHRPAFVIFGGEPGSRKTTLALALALGCVHRVPVLGRDVLGAGPALLVENDAPEGLFYSQLKRLERGMGLHDRPQEFPLEFFHGQGIDLAEPEWRRRFLEDVKRLRPAITLIDSFSGVHAADEDKLIEMEPVLQCLMEARNLTGGFVIAIDHVTKRLGVRRHGDPRTGGDVRGSGAKGARADSIWIFSEVKELSRMACVKDKAGIRPEPILFGPDRPGMGEPFALVEEGQGTHKSEETAREDLAHQDLLRIGEQILQKVSDHPRLTKNEYRSMVRANARKFLEAWDHATSRELIQCEPGKRHGRTLTLWFRPTI